MTWVAIIPISLDVNGPSGWFGYSCKKLNGGNVARVHRQISKHKCDVTDENNYETARIKTRGEKSDRQRADLQESCFSTSTLSKN